MYIYISICQPVSSSPSSQPSAFLTALVHSSNFRLLVAASVCGENVLRPSLLTVSNSRTLLHTPTAKPAAIAAPNAVVSRINGRSTSMPMVSACSCCQVSAWLMQSRKSVYIGIHLHTNIRIAHSTVHSQNMQSCPAVFLHCIQDGLCLKACRFDGCSCDMLLPRVL